MQSLSRRLSSMIRFAHEPSPNGMLGCIVFTGSTNRPGGYGQIRNVGTREMLGAHNAALYLAGIVTPAGTEPDHLCRRRTCVNVKHLEFVTPAVNRQRGARTRLLPQQVEEIRRQYKAGAPRQEIADLYGISRQQVHNIATHKRWR